MIYAIARMNKRLGEAIPQIFNISAAGGSIFNSGLSGLGFNSLQLAAIK
jgi:hypothetical protein